MHHFPGQPFQLPPLIRQGRVIPPPRTYQPPWARFQPVVLAYPATMYASIGLLSMTIMLSLGPDGFAPPPVMAFAPRSLAVLQ